MDKLCTRWTACFSRPMPPASASPPAWRRAWHAVIPRMIAYVAELASLRGRSSKGGVASAPQAAPRPEVFLPHDPRLPAQVVGRHGPEVIIPRVPGAIIPATLAPPLAHGAGATGRPPHLALLDEARLAGLSMTPAIEEKLGHGHPCTANYVSEWLAAHGRAPRTAQPLHGDPAPCLPHYAKGTADAPVDQAAVVGDQPAAPASASPKAAVPSAPSPPSTGARDIMSRLNSAAIPGLGLPSYGPPRMDDAPARPGTLSGPAPSMPHITGMAAPSASDWAQIPPG